MTSQMAADLAEPVISAPSIDGDLLSAVRPKTAVPQSPVTDSTYTLASDQSLLSSNVDHWIRGYHSNDTENIGTQGSRIPVMQRSILATSSSLDATGFWYLLAMVVPFFSYNNNWRCTPSLVMHTAEIFLNHLSRFCGQVRAYFRRMAHDQLARELFATAMDIVLVIYAFGFLALSLYQATMFE